MVLILSRKLNNWQKSVWCIVWWVRRNGQSWYVPARAGLSNAHSAHVHMEPHNQADRKIVTLKSYWHNDDQKSSSVFKVKKLWRPHQNSTHSAIRPWHQHHNKTYPQCTVYSMRTRQCIYTSCINCTCSTSWAEMECRSLYLEIIVKN